jgi:hypothetical protein
LFVEKAWWASGLMSSLTLSPTCSTMPSSSLDLEGDVFAVLVLQRGFCRSTSQ